MTIQPVVTMVTKYEDGSNCIAEKKNCLAVRNYFFPDKVLVI